MMKKILVAALALAMIAFLIPAFALAEEIPLRVWIGTNSTVWINDVIERFQGAHPEKTYRIEVSLQAEADCAAAVLNNPLAAADVFTFTDDQFDSLCGFQALMAVADPNAVIAANTAGAIAAATGPDGSLYAYPYTVSSGYFMFYNKAYFAEEDVQSLDRMLEVAAAAGKKVSFPMSNGWYLYAFFKGAGLDMTANDDGLSNTCNWNATDTPITGMQVVQALLVIAAHPGFAEADSDPFIAGVKNGSIIAGVSGTWNASAVQEAWGENYAAAKLPTYTVGEEQVQMASFSSYGLVGVNAYSDYADDALEFAAFMTDEASQTSHFEMWGLIPTNVSAAASKDVQAAPASAALSAQSAYATVQRVAIPYWDPVAMLGSVIARGNPDEADLQALLDRVVAGITAE
ncbi:MAG: extracellular solute-binding protein [Christensenellaceae bacterium]|nr:extracellular solute-binding protein [Christensenellaceae bacterium]